MKILCEKCNTSLKNEVNKKFEQFEVGRIKCPKCNTTNMRYISELDVLLYFTISALLYGVASSIIYLIFQIFNIKAQFIVLAILIVLLLVGVYFLSKNISVYIFENAPFKKEWKNVVFEEDSQVISKRLKWQFILFMVVAITFGTQMQYITYFFILIFAFIVIEAIKIYLLIKSEKEYYLKKGKK